MRRVVTRDEHLSRHETVPRERVGVRADETGLTDRCRGLERRDLGGTLVGFQDLEAGRDRPARDDDDLVTVLHELGHLRGQ